MAVRSFSNLGNDTVGDTHSGNQDFFSKRSWQAVGRTGSGSGAATIIIEGSNDDTNYLELGEIVLALTTSDSSDAIVTCSAWRFARMRITAISGTGATVDFYIAHGE